MDATPSGRLFESGAADPPAPAPSRAMDHAARLLALRARTTKEVAERLSGAGYEPEIVQYTVARLTELGLLDDAAFARNWLQERSRRKGLAGTALVEELTAKGIDREVAEAALADAGLDDVSTATELAAGHMQRLAGLPLRKQAARLESLLARRGFSEEACETALRAVLPPEGWD